MVHLPGTRISPTQDEYHRPIYPEIEEYMRRHVANDQDWEQVDDEDCWGVDYMEPTSQIREKMTAILHTWGEEQPKTIQVGKIKLSSERERFSVPHAARDPQVLKDRNLENEDIFELIKNPPEIGAVRIFEQPELWDTSIGPVQAVTAQGITTVYLPSGPLSMDGAQWHLLKYTLTNDDPNSLGSNLQNELTRQLKLDKDKQHRSFSWKLLRTLKSVFHATQYQGDTALTTPPFFKNARRGAERIWGEITASTQPMVIDWPGLTDMEKTKLSHTLSTTNNWILLTHPLGA